MPNVSSCFDDKIATKCFNKFLESNKGKNVLYRLISKIL